MPKKVQAEIQGLGIEFPGKPIVSVVEIESACVTAYVDVPSEAAYGVVRWNLFSELEGIRQLLASVWTLPGYSGVIASVTGYVADGFHLEAQTSNPRQPVRGGLIATECCAAPSVVVPSPLQQPPPNTPDEMLAPNPAPLQAATGRIRVHAMNDPDPGDVLTLAPGERVLSIHVGAGGNNSSFDVLFADGTSETISNANNGDYVVKLDGVAAPVEFFNFTNNLRAISIWTAS